jgi:opacity protein-like surface antigen
MKKLVLTIILLLLILPSINAQVNFSIYSGFGRSSFDKEIFKYLLSNSPIFDNYVQLANISQSDYIPIGAQLTYTLPVLFTFGIEANYAAKPYTFDVSAPIGNQNMKVAELKVHQFMIGALAKVRLLPGPVVPYFRAGAGLVSGGIDINWDSQFAQLANQIGIQLPDTSINVKNAVGVNLGGGVDINFSESGALFAEIVYYFIQREKDITGAQSFQANNYAIQIGWRFNFNK